MLQAEAAIAATGGKGNYVLLAGQAGHSVATEITRGYEDTLAPYVARGDIEIVMKQNHSAWSPEQALKTVEDALTRTGGHIDAILANNSGMARGAVQAITPRASARCSSPAPTPTPRTSTSSARASRRSRSSRTSSRSPSTAAEVAKRCSTAR